MPETKGKEKRKMVYWLYKNRISNIVVYSQKTVTEMGGCEKWSLIGALFPRIKLLDLYS